MRFAQRSLRRSALPGFTAAIAVGLASGLVACGGGPETVTQDVPVTDDVVVTDTEKKVKTEVETDVETVDDDSGGSAGAGGGSADAGNDTGGGTADAGNDCPAGEVLSAPGNKCRPGDDSDFGK